MQRINLSRFLLLQVLMIGTGTLFASASPPSSSPSPPSGGGRIVARIHVQDKRHLDAVAGELDIWETHPEAGYVVAALSPEEEVWLTGLGYRVEVDRERTVALAARSPLDPRFYYFDDQYPNPNGLYVVDLLQGINAAYPDVTELIDIGDAWLAGEPGEPHRDMWVLRITNEDPAYGAVLDKPVFFLFAAMHAREVAAAELAIRYLQYLTTGYGGEGGYGVDADVTWLVDHHVAYVLVMQNPDGHVENERDPGNNRRKNMDSDDGCSYPLEWGVDLNRNHSFLWGCCGGSSSDPCRATYRGPSRVSEPETQAFESYFATVVADQNGPNGDDEVAPASPITTTGIFISLHSYGDLVLWPWGFDEYGESPNFAELQTIGRKFALFNGYDASGTIWYDVDGATDDWTYGKFGIASYTFEVGPGYGTCGGFFPLYECIDGYAGRDFWEENKGAFLYAHKIARMPFATAYGPDAKEVTFSHPELPEVRVGQLTATILDDRCCGDAPQSIAAAEYFVDVPGEDGTGTPMSPVDGGWGELSEECEAPIDPYALTLGQHVILVHGRGDDGTWGPFSATFVEIDHSLYLPLVIP